MVLKDCTKDELVYFIERECRWRLDRLEPCVLTYRATKAGEASQKATERTIAAITADVELTKSYLGMKISDIPPSAIKQMQKAREKIKRCEAAERRAERWKEAADRELEAYWKRKEEWKRTTR